MGLNIRVIKSEVMLSMFSPKRRCGETLLQQQCKMHGFIDDVYNGTFLNVHEIHYDDVVDTIVFISDRQLEFLWFARDLSKF